MDKENIELMKQFPTHMLIELFHDAVSMAEYHLKEADRHNSLCNHYQGNARLYDEILKAREAQDAYNQLDQSAPVSSPTSTDTSGKV